MPIGNVLASLAVKNLKLSQPWYETLLEMAASSPMAEVAEWSFARGGGLQVYQLPERAGKGSCTFAVDDIEACVATLRSMGVDTSERVTNARVKTVMVTDPDGNHLAFAQALDPTLTR
ncbi:hypothetical protein BH09PSE6_BH09PSE6_08430 [soil metagenome]